MVHGFSPRIVEEPVRNEWEQGDDSTRQISGTHFPSELDVVFNVEALKSHRRYTENVFIVSICEC